MGQSACRAALQYTIKHLIARASEISKPDIGTLNYLLKHWFTWWRHQMETFSALLAFSAGKSLVPVNSPYKGQWRRPLMFSLIFAWINGWVNNREAYDLRRDHTHYDVIVMIHHILCNTAWCRWLLIKYKQIVIKAISGTLITDNRNVYSRYWAIFGVYF